MQPCWTTVCDYYHKVFMVGRSVPVYNKEEMCDKGMDLMAFVYISVFDVTDMHNDELDVMNAMDIQRGKSKITGTLIRSEKFIKIMVAIHYGRHTLATG